MSNHKKALIVLENCFVPLDVRVWYEATTLRDAGWQPTIVCPAPTGVHAANSVPVPFGQAVDIEGIKVYFFPLTFAEGGVAAYLHEYLSAFTAIARLSWAAWRSNGFDVIHLCNPPDIFFPLAWLYRMLGARVVFDHHDLFPEAISHSFGGRTGRLLHGLASVMEYLTFHTAHVTMSTNESYRQVAIDRGRLSPDRVLVLRNGPKMQEFCPVEPVPALKQGFDHMVCYAGMMGPQDGVYELLDSIRHIVHGMGCNDVLFALLGDGAVYAEALEMVGDWRLDGTVHMPGMIRDKELLRQYLCTADVCVSPEPLTPLNERSTFIKIGEYMAMGKPVVAYDLPESRHTAQDAALFVETGDAKAFGEAVVALLHDAGLRHKMGEAGRQRFVNELSWEHQQRNLLRAYELASARNRLD